MTQDDEPVLRVVLVEDKRDYRDAIRSVFAQADGVALVDSYSRGEDAIRAAEHHASRGIQPWDVVLMDIDLPGMDGIDTTRRVKAALDTEVIMLTVFEEPRKIVDAICAGASGYLLKSVSARELLSQLRSVQRGGAGLSGDVARRVLQIVRDLDPSSQRDAIAHPHPARLTERERDILRGLVRGLTYRGIAEAEGVSIETVRSHIKSVYRKLHVHSATAAVKRAIREGLT